MKYILLLIASLCFLSACRSTKQEKISDTYIASATDTRKSKYETLYFELRDSIRMGKAPTEKSSSIGLQRSELKTTLARSLAFVNESGLLFHEIENNDSIPEKIIIHNKIHTIYDTIYIHKSDTIYKNNSIYVEKELSFVQKIKSTVGDIAIILLVIGGVILLIKRGLKK